MRDFINVDDVATANLIAMDYRGATRIFNVGTGVGTTINSIAQLLKEMVRKSTEVNYLPLQPGEPSSSIADVSLAKSELGFQARWSLQEKLAEVIEWNLKKH